jgi:hypothetical protein
MALWASFPIGRYHCGEIGAVHIAVEIEIPAAAVAEIPRKGCKISGVNVLVSADVSRAIGPDIDGNGGSPRVEYNELILGHFDPTALAGRGILGRHRGICVYRIIQVKQAME